jgi:hypothetical protein
MKRQPIAVIASLLALTALALADEAQLVPLQDYIAQPVEKDPAAIGYVMRRCSALYSVFAKNLEDETDPERQKFKAEALSAGEKFMGFAVEMMMHGTTITMKDALVRTQNIVVELGNLYTDRIAAVRLRTNNMFADALIAGDFATCKGLLGKM